MEFSFTHPYPINKEFSRKVAYFCMEFGIHQPLKTYAGGLGFLAGSHMRSAFELKQNMVGIGILWKYGYYDQGRKSDQTMEVLFMEKIYGFLKRTNINFFINVSGHKVHVTAHYLPPEVFNTPPIFFLSTDLPENDYLARTISHKLYDYNPETKVAAAILLGEGGAKLLKILNWEPDVYHLNESHALPLAFYLYNQYKNINDVKKRLVYTNHTPEEAGNPKTDITLLERMGYFCEVPMTEIRAIAHIADDQLDHTLTALKLSGKANTVSKMHHQTIVRRYGSNRFHCEIISITNAQNYPYWHNTEMYNALEANDDERLWQAKMTSKKELFELVADQNGEIYDEKICTIVFAKRFAGYKRPDLLLQDMDRFHRIVTSSSRPVQIIWAGKPYPMDFANIGTFDRIVNVCKSYPNCAVLSGYELKLSKLLKRGADVWLNIPRITHEASGTSGMSAAMNGAINVAIPDGWFPEFASDKKNAFVIPSSIPGASAHIQDAQDANELYDLLENEIIPLYYDYPGRWLDIVKNSMRDIVPAFDSNRMAREYYDRMYSL